MLVERNVFDKTRATSLEDLRAKCMGCTDCTGPCLMLRQLSGLPEIVLGLSEARA